MKPINNFKWENCILWVYLSPDTMAVKKEDSNKS